MTASDNNWPPVVGNLRKAQKNWVRMLRILGQEGSDPQTTGNFYKVVVQSTLLLGAESWLMPPWIGRNLGRFHHKVAVWL